MTDGLSNQTSYAYDPLSDLTTVTNGSEPRTFVYDSLGRLYSSTIPETAQCTVTFGYDPVGNMISRVAPKEGQISCNTKVTTTTAYDELNRVLSKSYNDGITPTVNYSYDQSSYNGLSITNRIGHQTGMSDGSGQTAWSFDERGRTVTEKRTIGTVTKTLSYLYNDDGSLVSLTYPNGRVINYAYNAAGQPLSAVDPNNSINYAQYATYAPQGGLASMLNAQGPGFTGETETIGYDNRLRPASFVASSQNGNALNLSYTYYGNSSVNVVTNNLNSGRTQTFTYDALNRLATARSSATSGQACWGQSIPTDGTGYDRYGNLLKINITKCVAPALNVTVDTHNHVGANGYDAAGNVTSDGTNNYTWDAEGKMLSGGGVTYTYDGEGQRVKKSSGILYWYAPGGNLLTETDTSGGLQFDYIYFGTQRIARASASTQIYIYAGALGSAQAETDNTGHPCHDSDFYPFGGELVFTSTCSQNFQFAGMYHDGETGLEHTLDRQYSSNQGRWLSPDPSGVKAVNLANPQTWNMYAYVTDNPTTLTDPLGLANDNAPVSTCKTGTTMECTGNPDADRTKKDTTVKPTAQTNWSLSWQVSASTNFLAGEVKGVADVTVTPLVNAVEHPIATAESVVNAVQHPVDTTPPRPLPMER